ncbi:hypothetical protein ACJMK2_037282, partial [Sinanodonta woodiana]
MQNLYLTLQSKQEKQQRGEKGSSTTLSPTKSRRSMTLNRSSVVGSSTSLITNMIVTPSPRR